MFTWETTRTVDGAPFECESIEKINDKSLEGNTLNHPLRVCFKWTSTVIGEWRRREREVDEEETSNGRVIYDECPQGNEKEEREEIGL